MRYLIFGKGYIGSKFKSFYGDKAVVSDKRILLLEDAYSEIKSIDPDVVINCIGVVGTPNIDWCEDHKIETLFGNVMVPFFIDKACQELNVKLVHIGTGCIYQGNKMFDETDLPNFVGGTYVKSKYLIEQSLGLGVLQLRIRMPIDGEVSDRNLLTKILKPVKTTNAFNSLTVVPDLLKACDELINKDAYGIFNVTNPNPISNNQILEIYNKYATVKKEIINFSIDDFRASVKAPRSICTLNTDKLNSYGIYMKNTLESLDGCIKEYVKNVNNH